MTKPVRRVTAPNLIAVGVLIKHLMDGRLTNRQLAEVTGLAYLTVCRYTAAIYNADAAFITRLEIDNRGAQTIRVYKLGTDDDAEPIVRPRAVRARAQRHRERVQKPPLRGVLTG